MSAKERLIEKLYQGRCSRKELEILFDLMNRDSGEDARRIMNLLWRQLKFYPELEASLADRMLKKTLARIEATDSKTDTKIILIKKKQPTLVSRRYFWKVASVAAILLIAVSTFSWFGLKGNQQIVIQTTFGEQKLIELPDHSLVKLNANSSLSYYKNWEDSDVRQVWLNGEAYFEVQKKEQKEQKFQVITKDLAVEVLGTVFNVNARTESTKVFLEEGEVNLDLVEQEEDIAMQPGDLVVYSKQTKEVPKKLKIVKEAPASWKDGTALIEDSPLRDIIQKITEIHGVSIEVENKDNLDREFTIGIPVDKLEMTYLLLQDVTGLKISKLNKEWIIK